VFAAIDAGGKNSVGWAASIGRSGDQLDELGILIRDKLKSSRVVLAIEAPLWIPLRAKHRDMTQARNGEGLSWASRISSGAIAPALANLSVILRTAAPTRLAFEETDDAGSIVIVEAYHLSSAARAARAQDDCTRHIQVAKNIVNALVERWPDRFVCPITRPSGEQVLNLAAAVGSALGIPIASSDLARETKVIDPCRLD
jgi:hypothetical protein